MALKISPITDSSGYKPYGALRFFLALLVADAHTHFLMGDGSRSGGFISSQGTIAVMIFFVLSGYVITASLNRFYKHRIVQFFTNRILRLFPAYFAALAISISLHGLLLWFGLAPGPVQGVSRGVGGALALMSRDIPMSEAFSLVNIIGNILVMPLIYGIGKLGFYPIYSFVPNFWSLNVEIQYYMAAGLIWWVIYSGIPLTISSFNLRVLDDVYLPDTSTIFPRIFLTIVSLAGCSLYFAAVEFHVELFRYFRYLPYFLAGTCIYFYEWRFRLGSLVGLVVLLLGISYEAYHPADITRSYMPWSVVAGVLLGCILVWVLAQCTLEGKWKQLDKRLGDLSYPLYLIHFAATFFCSNLFRTRNVIIWLLALGMSVSMAWLINRLIESYFERYRDRIRGMT